MATRWTKARKRWSPDIAKNCYPMYHQQFEILDEAEVTWNPWTQDQLKMFFDARHFTPSMLTDSAFWLTRCNLLFLWLTNMGRGWSLYDWREDNIEWVHKWENEALADIVHQLRPYDGSIDQAYKQWYCMNTRASLASQPATIPTHLTQEEQARRHVELHAAYYRDQMDTPDVNWGDENTQRGINTGLRGASHDHGVNAGLRGASHDHGVNTGFQGASHDLGDPVTSLVTEFFGGDVIGPSFIPAESQPYAYNYASGSQQGFATPPPTQDSQTHEAELEYGRGLRVTRPPNRLSPSGRKERPGGRRKVG
ncbi:hypothetical protein ACQJBY_015435 [Aegilops geniculata]